MRAAVAAAGALLALVTTACSGPHVGPQGTQSTSPRAQPSAQPLVQRVALSDTDLRAAYKILPVRPDGGVLGDHVAAVRLGVGVSPISAGCGTPLASWPHRVDRWLGAVFDTEDRDNGVVDEVVQYDTDGHARAALDELRRAARHCPRHRFVRSPGQDAPGLRYVESWSYREPQLPVHDNAVMYRWVRVRGMTRHVFEFYVFQRVGTLLEGVYVTAEQRIPDRYLKGYLDLAAIAGDKLAQSSVAS